MMTEEKKKRLLESRDYGEKQFDQLIIYLSSGALLFTTTFVQEILEIGRDTNKFFLKSSWVLFVFSLFTMLISHKISVVAMDARIKEEKGRWKYWNKVVGWFNWAALIFFIFGIVSFIIFSFMYL